MHGFSDDERERIREQLVESGRRMLLAYGPKKTNVVDVTEPAGIAKSTFYRFFDSKADLYLEIVRREGEKYRDDLRQELEGVDEPREGLELMFRSYRAFAEENPFIQQMLNQPDYRAAFGSASPERLDAARERKFENTVPFVEALQERGTGLLAQHDPETIIGVMGVIGLVVLHHDELEAYGEEYYERTQDLLVEALARGLTA